MKAAYIPLLLALLQAVLCLDPIADFSWAGAKQLPVWTGDTSSLDMDTTYAYINNNTFIDMVAFWMQSDGTIYYRIFWDAQPCGGYDFTDKNFISSRFLSVGQVYTLATFPTVTDQVTRSMGASIADINRNGRPDIYFHYCFRYAVYHYCYYCTDWWTYEDYCVAYIAWDMDMKGAAGSITGGYRMPGYFYYIRDVAWDMNSGVDIRDINKDGVLDGIFFVSNMWAGTTSYVMFKLDTSGGMNSVSTARSVGYLANDVTLGDFTNDSSIDAAFIWTTRSPGTGYVWVGWNIGLDGTVAGWSNADALPGVMDCGGIATGDMMDDNVDDMIIAYHNGTYGSFWKASTYYPLSLIRKII